MCKRLVIVLGLVILIVGVGYLTLWLTTPKQHVTREAYERITEGMTLAEVEAVIGLPPGDHTNGPSVVEVVEVGGGGIDHVKIPTKEHLGDIPSSWRVWIGDRGMILVIEGADGKLETYFRDVYPADPSLLDRFRNLFRLGG